MPTQLEWTFSQFFGVVLSTQIADKNVQKFGFRDQHLRIMTSALEKRCGNRLKSCETFRFEICETAEISLESDNDPSEQGT